MKKIIILLLIVTISIKTFAASVDVSGTLSVNTHWTGIDTIKITGNLSINDGVTLLIDPGIIVEVQGMYYIDVQGRIIATGTETDSIKFTALDKVIGWNRFLYVGTPVSNDSSYFNYCIFEYGLPVNNSDANKDGGAFYINGFSKLYIRNSLFRYNQGINAVVYIVRGEIIINKNIFTNNINYSILASGSYKSIVSNNIFLNNTGTAIYSGNNDESYYLNNVIDGNSSGFLGYESKATLANNTIVNNMGSGLMLNSNSNVYIYNTIIRDNTFQVNLLNDNTDPNFYYCNIEGGSAGFTGAGAGGLYTGAYLICIDSNPLFTDANNGDYSLPVNSPCVNTGVSGAFLSMTDIVGNPRISDDIVDIGAYEYYVAVDTICDQTWTEAVSPYLINSNIVIANGCTLTINPGVEIIFNGFYKIKVLGTIKAIGTLQDSVKFTSANTTEGWQGIKYIDNITLITSEFRFCSFEHAKPANYYNNSYSNGGTFQLNNFYHLDISNCSFKDSYGVNGVVYLADAEANITNSIFTGNTGYCIMNIGSYEAYVANNKFINNSGTAIYTGYSDPTFYTGNLLTGNTGGFFVYNSEATLVNNTIVNNINFGIILNANSDIDIYNSIIRGNGQEVNILNMDTDPNFYNCNILNDTAGFTGSGAHGLYTGIYQDCIDANPLFVDELSGNYQLAFNSPNINNGFADTTGLFLLKTDLNSYFRVDNDTIDIGAYERDKTPPIAIVNAADEYVFYTNPYTISIGSSLSWR